VLSDRFGARPFATGGMLIAAASFTLLLVLPVNFNYWAFAGVLLLDGLGMGMFSSPNRAGIMNSLPARQRGAGAGMAATFQNSATVLSIGIFFSLMILGLASSLGSTLSHGLIAQGVSATDATRISHLPPVATLFASLLGYNPVQQLLGPSAHTLSAAHQHFLTGREFFPNLISSPFHDGLRVAFLFASVACLVAAWASWLRGGKFHYDEDTGLGSATGKAPGAAAPEPVPSHVAAASADTAADRTSVPTAMSAGGTLAAVPT
jgi:hypothetical protein